MTLIFMICAVCISENLPDQCHLRSIIYNIDEIVVCSPFASKHLPQGRKTSKIYACCDFPIH